MMRSILIASVAIACGYLLFARYFGLCGDDVFVAIGTSEYCLPREVARFEERSALSDLVSIFDRPVEGKGALILFSRLDYKKVVPEYEIERDVNNEPMIEDLVLVAPVNEVEMERYKYHGARERYFQDLWFGEGQWSDRRLEPMDENGWYRAYWTSHDRSSWQVLSGEPSRETENYLRPGFAIALCHYTVRERKTCKTSYLAEDRKMLIDLDLDEGNLKYRDRIGAHILKTLDSWAIRTGP